MKSFRAHSNGIIRIKQSPYNGYVATCSDDNTVKIWDTSNWNLIQNYMGHSNRVYGLEFINVDTVASGSYDKYITIWSISSGATMLRIETKAEVMSLAYLKYKLQLAAGLNNGDLNIYNINTGSLISTLKVMSVVFDLILLNNGFLASSCSQAVVISSESSIKFNLTGHTNFVYGLKEVSPNSNILASGSSDNTIKIWNTLTGQLIRTLTGHTNYILWSLDLLNDGQTLVSGSWDQTIKLWNWSTGQLLNTFNTGLLIRSLAVVNPTIITSTSKY